MAQELKHDNRCTFKTMVKLVHLIESSSGKCIQVSHEYALGGDNGLSKEWIKQRFSKVGSPLGFIGFLEKAKPLPYSSLAVIDHPNIHFVRKQRAWRSERSEVADGEEMPQAVATSVGNVLPLICYDAYRFGSGKAPIGPWEGIDLLVVPAWWEKNFPLVQSAVKRLGRKLECSAVVADVLHGHTIYNYPGGLHLEVVDG